MKVQHHAILCGASFIAMSVAMPLQAQTVPINGGMLLPNPFVTVTTNITAGGVTATGSAPTAKVVDLTTGEAAQIVETAAPASLTNGGTTTITADASGAGTAAAAVGNIAPDVPGTTSFQAAFTQKSLLADVDGATWNASATLLNTGSLSVRSRAASTDGNATATVVGGVAQKASVETKGRTSTAVLNNSGAMNVGAS